MKSFPILVRRSVAWSMTSEMLLLARESMDLYILLGGFLSRFYGSFNNLISNNKLMDGQILPVYPTT